MKIGTMTSSITSSPRPITRRTSTLVLLYAFVVAFLLSHGCAQKRVVDLTDRNCQGEVLTAEVHHLRVYASCGFPRSAQLMRVSVSLHAPAEEGPLRMFSIEFCGPSVIDASGPTGWTARVDRFTRNSVEWSLPDDLVASRGIPAGVKTGGFVVRLTPGWKRSGGGSASWGDSRNRSWLTTHDC